MYCDHDEHSCPLNHNLHSFPNVIHHQQSTDSQQIRETNMCLPQTKHNASAMHAPTHALSLPCTRPTTHTRSQWLKFWCINHTLTIFCCCKVCAVLQDIQYSGDACCLKCEKWGGWSGKGGGGGGSAGARTLECI